MKKLLSFLSAISLVGTASTSSVACLKKEVPEPSNDAEAFANQILNRSIELVSVGFIDGNSSSSNTMREALLYGLFLANRGLEAQVQQDNITLTFARGVNISRQRGINTEIDLTIISGDDGSSTTLTMSAGLPVSTFIDQQFVGLIANQIDNAEIEITQELASPDLSDPATRAAVLSELTRVENLTPLQSRAIQVSTNQGVLNKQGFNVDFTAASGGQTAGATVLVQYDIVKIIAQKITNRSIILPDFPTTPTITDATKTAIKTKLQDNNPSLSQADLNRIIIADSSSPLNLGGAPTFVSWSILDGDNQPEIQPEQLSVSVISQPITATFYSDPATSTTKEGQTAIFNNQLWYATNQGLQYFNGNQLTTFTQGALTANDDILRVVTTTGHLWVIAEDSGTGADKAYAISAGQSGYTAIELQLGASTEIEGMVVAQNTNTVYISNESSGLYKFAFDDPNDGQLIAPPPSWSSNEFIVGLQITAAVAGVQYVLAYTDFGKMYRLINDPTDAVTEISLQPTSGPVISRGPFADLISRGDTFFLGLVNGIIRVTNFTANTPFVEAYGNADGRITKIVPDNQGNLWITSNSDLRLLRSGGSSIETLPNSPSAVADITSNDAFPQSVFITAGPQNIYSLQRWTVDGQIPLTNIAGLDQTFTSTNIAAFPATTTQRQSLLVSGTTNRLQRAIFNPWNTTANVDSVTQAINFFYQPVSQNTVYGFTANGVYVINFSA